MLNIKEVNWEFAYILSNECTLVDLSKDITTEKEGTTVLNLQE
jgi:hypothetical protein